MEVSIEAIRDNFQSKADTELLEIAASSSGMTSEARFLLLQELQNRLVKAKQARETVQLIHGWYTVVAPIAGITFPKSCPRCLRSEADSSLRFESLKHRKFPLIYWKSDSMVSAVPHCFNCAAELKKTRAICSIAGCFLALLWFVSVIWFRIPRLVSYVGFFAISLPIMYLYDRTSAVKLGDHGDEVVEYRFRSHEYAAAFAAINNVQAENAETLRDQLEDAISTIRQ